MSTSNAPVQEHTSTLFAALRPPEGGDPKGYLCRKCGAVTKSGRGIISHLWQAHKLRLQLDFDFPE